MRQAGASLQTNIYELVQPSRLMDSFDDRLSSVSQLVECVLFVFFSFLFPFYYEVYGIDERKREGGNQ